MRNLVSALTLAVSAIALAAVTALPAAAQNAGAAALPDGWNARFDRANTDMSQVKVEMKGDSLHFSPGPSGIFYRQADSVSGNYTVNATFTQTRAPQHPEAYGIILGGRNLQAPNQDYLYFIIRGDGRYMVRHRAGEELHTIAEWTEHPAIVKQDESGRQTNTLTAEATAEGLRLLVNGQEIANYRKADVPFLNTNGIAGLRVNHNLDLVVTGGIVRE